MKAVTQFTASAVLALSLASTAAWANVPRKPTPIKQTGFSIVKESPAAMTLLHGEEFELTISRDRFYKMDAAQAFCASQGSTLDTDFNALLVSMSGAADANRFLRNAVTFSYSNGKRDVTGVWAWAGQGDKIKLMYDKGLDAEEVTSKEMTKRAQTVLVELPAICIKKVEAVASIDSMDRENE